MLLNTFRRIFSNAQNRKARRSYAYPQLLQLESRIVPATYTVANTSDAGAGSLRQAIDDANNNAGDDQISFKLTGVNTIILGSALPIIVSASTAIVTGGTAGIVTITNLGAPSLIISGSDPTNANNATRNFNIFKIASGGDLSISGVTVSGAQTTNNGGAFNNAGTLTVSNSTISGNKANGVGVGGGIYNKFGGTLTVTKSTISGNTAFSSGGGIFNGGKLMVTDSTISGNSSSFFGGGIYNSGTLTVTNSTI